MKGSRNKVFNDIPNEIHCSNSLEELYESHLAFCRAGARRRVLPNAVNEKGDNLLALFFNEFGAVGVVGAVILGVLFMSKAKSLVIEAQEDERNPDNDKVQRQEPQPEPAVILVVANEDKQRSQKLTKNVSAGVRSSPDPLVNAADYESHSNCRFEPERCEEYPQTDED